MEKSLFNPIFLHKFFRRNQRVSLYFSATVPQYRSVVCVFVFFHDFSWLSCKNDTNINTKYLAKYRNRKASFRKNLRQQQNTIEKSLKKIPSLT